MKNSQYYALKKGDRVVVTKGKCKNQKASVDSDGKWKSKISLQFDDGTHDYIAYENVEVLDEHGQILTIPVTDQTNRIIKVGTWLVYAVGGGKSPAALEIGKVESISEKGALKVLRILRDGEKIDSTRSYTREYAIVADTARTVSLPVDTTTMTKWVLTDFEGMDDDL